MPRTQSNKDELMSCNFRQNRALAIVLALGAAVSLGVTRFSYGLLLPSMRADLGWSYTLAGAMNTINALGYLIGAHRIFTSAEPLLLQRLLAGIASAWVFVSGGLLAAPASSRIWAGLQMVMAD